MQKLKAPIFASIMGFPSRKEPEPTRRCFTYHILSYELVVSSLALCVQSGIFRLMECSTLSCPYAIHRAP
jgi:hypothetical protein